MLGIWFQLNLTLSDLSLRTARVHLLMPSYRLYSKRSQQKGPLQCSLPPWGDRVHVYHITSHSPVGCAPPALGNGLSVNLSSRDSQHSERIVNRYSLSFSLSFPLSPYASFSTCPSYFFGLWKNSYKFKNENVPRQMEPRCFLSYVRLHVNGLHELLHFYLNGFSQIGSINSRCVPVSPIKMGEGRLNQQLDAYCSKQQNFCGPGNLQCPLQQDTVEMASEAIWC